MWSLRLSLVAVIVGVSGGALAARLFPEARWPWAVLAAAVLLEVAGEWALRRRAWQAQADAVVRLELEEAERILRELWEFSAGQPAALGRIELQLAAIDSMRGRFVPAR